MEKELTCKERLRGAYRRRMAEVRKLWNLYRNDPEARTEDGEQWNEYGLSFDYVPVGTFNNQRRGFFRYQISYGGPSEEFRFYSDEKLNLISCNFHFLDWFDGASARVYGLNLETWREIWEDFRECETLQYLMKQAE